jgi:protein-S-isoprenylcysteine O-methyltransferase Ste14
MNDLRQKLFHYRGYTPIPFLLVMVVFAKPALATFIVGAVVLALGELTRFWGVAFAGPLTRVTGGVGAPMLVVAGPFAYVRNPLYVGNILMYGGIGIMAGALNPWLVIAAASYFIFQYWMIVSLEEEFLEKEFGESYDEYRRNVPRFIPRPNAWKPGREADQHPDWKGAVKSEKRTFQAILLVSILIVLRWIWG